MTPILKLAIVDTSIIAVVLLLESAYHNFCGYIRACQKVKELDAKIALLERK